MDITFAWFKIHVFKEIRSLKSNYNNGDDVVN